VKNIIEQRYDFLVDAKALERLDGAMLRRLLQKLYQHKGWLYNYLYYKLPYDALSASQQLIISECGLRFYGKPVGNEVAH
jgi:hypothetical protein